MEVAAKTDREVLLEMFDLPPDALSIIHDNDAYNRWFNTSATFREILPLGMLKAKYDAGDVGNFVYYRDSGMVFNTLNSADHNRFMSGLFNLYLLKKGERDISDEYRKNPSMSNLFSGTYDGQDRFLRDGLGAYQSSCGRQVYFHKNLMMNAQEKMVFRDMPKEVCDW